MEEKQHGKLKSIFFLGIPFIFMAILCVFVLNLLGIPVWKTVQDWGNKIPVINLIIPDSAGTDTKKTGSSNYWKQKYLDNNSMIKEKDQKIADLKKELSSNQKGLEDLKLSNKELLNNLDSKQTQKIQDQMKRVAAIYQNIPASKAAAMLESMAIEDATLTISMMDQDLQSSILGSMKDAKKAGQITMLLKEIAGITNTADQATLQEQLHELAQKQENPTQTLSETIAGMPPAQSAVIIQSMMGTNSPVAMELLKNISTTSRSQILTEIAKADTKLAAQITANLNK